MEKGKRPDERQKSKENEQASADLSSAYRCWHLVKTGYIKRIQFFLLNIE